MSILAKMMRIAGRDPSGKARAIQVNETGEVVVSDATMETELKLVKAELQEVKTALQGTLSTQVTGSLVTKDTDGNDVLKIVEVAPAGYEEATDSQKVKLINSVDANILNFPNRKRESVVGVDKLQIRGTSVVTQVVDLSKYESFTLMIANTHDQPIDISFRKPPGVLHMVWWENAWVRTDNAPFKLTIPNDQLWYDLGTTPQHKELFRLVNALQLRFSSGIAPTTGNITVEIRGILRGE